MEDAVRAPCSEESREGPEGHIAVGIVIHSVHGSTGCARCNSGSSISSASPVRVGRSVTGVTGHVQALLSMFGSQRPELAMKPAPMLPCSHAGLSEAVASACGEFECLVARTGVALCSLRFCVLWFMGCGVVQQLAAGSGRANASCPVQAKQDEIDKRQTCHRVSWCLARRVVVN
ncbi:hypothetical protein CC85DRAFT_197768 [Cutaneotrichosporon oleaginosum]|uniref:Uncharacterized protein n=1 Tax=Cutaneotrichosporon oleaginosum TaxID=879819 RepID=A0A0J0XE21_9TREE|nr:uncharacterized protein CC85DRAFT_197768 [Cutaneotrichosporon oleaginosum]KLT39327.1 hypothetical protein CC85DRAFT_197768 [Cutaneotrichosporon oleaginosum]TXT08523.1 hypothetical protein COLE_05447 [Cutaneotrichosporon oleaginosum]